MATGGPPGANANPPASGDAAPGGSARQLADLRAEEAVRVCRACRVCRVWGIWGLPGAAVGLPAACRPDADAEPVQMQEQMRRQMQNQPAAAVAGMPGMPGMAGMPGSGAGPGGADNKPPDFHTPEGGVTAFLNALKARDLDRLTEATAIHAQVEARAKNQEIFKRIYDGSLSEQELDDLAKKLEGYQLAGYNPPKSTGRIDIILQKMSGPGPESGPGQNQNPSRFTRLITVRHEKRGWLVCDISGESEFKNPRMMPVQSAAEA